MNETRWERWGAASGLGAIVTGAAALRAQALLFVLGAGFFLWFLGSLRSFLARAEGGTGRLSAVAMGAGVASTVMTLAALAFQLGLASAAGYAGQPALVGTMDALFVIANLPLAVMLIAVAVLTVRPAARRATAIRLAGADPTGPLSDPDCFAPEARQTPDALPG
jgi:hypothetical protein